MKFIAAIIVLTVVVGCANEKAKADAGWEERTANAWAQSLGENSPHSVCIGSMGGNVGYCNTRVGEWVYRIECYYDDKSCRLLERY